jgi:hypothetical protein
MAGANRFSPFGFSFLPMSIWCSCIFFRS